LLLIVVCGTPTTHSKSCSWETTVQEKFLPSSQSQNVVLSDMKKEINPSSHHQMSQRMSCFLTLMTTTTALRRQIVPVLITINLLTRFRNLL
jgi:hypothetical protein